MRHWPTVNCVKGLDAGDGGGTGARDGGVMMPCANDWFQVRSVAS